MLYVCYGVQCHKNEQQVYLPTYLDANFVKYKTVTTNQKKVNKNQVNLKIKKLCKQKKNVYIYTYISGLAKGAFGRSITR